MSARFPDTTEGGSTSPATASALGTVKLSHAPADAASPVVVETADSRLTDSRAPAGTAGGVLSGTYPDPGFAVDMATQAELDAEASARASADTTLATAAANALARSNHTGTQTSATISDFTEAVQDAVGAALASGTGATVTYDDASNSITISATGTSDLEAIRDAVGVALVGAGNITVTVDDPGNTITISTAATVNSTDAALRDRSTHTGSQATSTVTGLDAALAALASQAATIPVWAASTVYVANQAVRYAGKVWTAKAAFTAGSTFDKLKWNLVGESNTASPFRGLTPMVNRLKPQVGPVSTGASGTQDSDYGLGHTVLVDGIVERVRFAYIPAATSPEVTTGLTPITFLSAALQYGGVIYRLKFNGQERFTLDPDGGSIESDPVNLPVVAGQSLYTKAHTTMGATGTGATNTSTSVTGVVCTSRGGFQVGQTISGTDIPASTTISEIRGNTIILSQAATGTTASVALTALGKIARGVAANTANDGVTNGAVTITNNAYVVGTPIIGGGGSQVMGPVAILGRTPNPKPIVGIIGDSIDLGTGNTSPSDESFITQALTAANIPHIDLGVGGDQATKWVASLGGRWRSGLVAGCTSVVIGMQTNDLAVASRTVAQVQSDLLQIATWCKTLGVTKVFTRTDSPRPSMSVNGKAFRLTLNDWKRDGHPIDATTKVAVATGTSSNVLRGGDPGHPIDALPFETADAWEASRNSGTWNATMDSGDGVHPGPAGHTAAQAVVAARTSEFV